MEQGRCFRQFVTVDMAPSQGDEATQACFVSQLRTQAPLPDMVTGQAVSESWQTIGAPPPLPSNPPADSRQSPGAARQICVSTWAPALAVVTSGFFQTHPPGVEEAFRG